MPDWRASSAVRAASVPASATTSQRGSSRNAGRWTCASVVAAHDAEADQGGSLVDRRSVGNLVGRPDAVKGSHRQGFGPDDYRSRANQPGLAPIAVHLRTVASTSGVWRRLAALVARASRRSDCRSTICFATRCCCIAAVTIFAGTISRAAQGAGSRRCAIVAIAVLGKTLFPAPRIEEGHNVFVVDGARRRAASRGCRPRPSALMAAEFDAHYPPDAPLRSEDRRLLARPGLSRPRLRLLRRRHLRPAGVFAARHRHRFLRSDVAAARLHQRTQIQLDPAISDVQREQARAPLAGQALASLAADHAVVRDVPVSGRVRRQPAVLARAMCCGKGADETIQRRCGTPNGLPADRAPRTSDGASSALRSRRAARDAALSRPTSDPAAPTGRARAGVDRRRAPCCSAGALAQARSWRCRSC